MMTCEKPFIIPILGSFVDEGLTILDVSIFETAFGPYLHSSYEWTFEVVRRSPLTDHSRREFFAPPDWLTHGVGELKCCLGQWNNFKTAQKWNQELFAFCSADRDTVHLDSLFFNRQQSSLLMRRMPPFLEITSNCPTPEPRCWQ